TTPFVESLRRDLLAAAEAAGPEGRAAADRMLLAFEPAMRLALLDALSQATAEITAELPAGVVEVRLRGREPELVVDVPPLHQPHPEPTTPPPTPDDEEDDGTVARITLRIPESVKTRAEELAAKSGHSLNAWIVTVLKAATTQRAINVDIDLSSLPFLDTPGSGRRPGGRRMSGWV
ncbi:MAG TPA: toxin-antitoxin system HicB family antitoxin, partial [Marmoricola sp.]|nr:toxin-antitoxin system HicB family antitoxin [Marmoricola sp.]